MKKDSIQVDGRILQGLEFLFSVPNTVRLTIRFVDPVDRVLMQAALTDVMSRTNWFNQSLYHRGDHFCLRKNTDPVLLYEEDGLRVIPGETNGYLFYFSVAGDTLIMRWEHFLTDARGAHRFLSAVAKTYCNSRYHTNFHIEDLEQKLPPWMVSGDMEAMEDAVPVSFPGTGKEPRAVVSADKRQWIERAVAYGVKPFSLLAFILAKAVGRINGKDAVSYAYSADFQGWDRSDLLCNTVVGFGHTIGFSGHTKELIRETDNAILSDLSDNRNLVLLANKTLEKFQYVYRQAFSFEEKKKMLGMISIYQNDWDFFLSYCGSAFHKADEGLAEFITDYCLSVYPHQGKGKDSPVADKIYFMSASTNERLNIDFCALDQTEKTAQILKEEFEKEKIPVTVEFPAV